MKSFQEDVLAMLAKIPRGRVTTYAALAKALGRPGAVRAMGTAVGKNPELIKIPCHRVVRSDCYVGEYAKGTKRKIVLLRKEGVEVKNGKVNLVKYGLRLQTGIVKGYKDTNSKYPNKSKG